MRKWDLALLMVAVASTAAAGVPVQTEDAAAPCGPVLRPNLRRAGELRQPLGASPQALGTAASGIVPRLDPTPVRRDDGQPLIAPSLLLPPAASGVPGAGADAPPAASMAARPGRGSSEAQAAGDVMVVSGYARGLWSGIRARCAWGQGTCPAGATNNDYYALRYAPAELARQLPFSIDQAWMHVENYYTWSRNWQLSVLAEDPAAPLTPRMAAPVAGPATLDVSQYYPTKSGTPPTSLASTNAKVDFVDAPYPASSMFAIDDKVMDDCFLYTGSITTNNNWIECSGPSTGCSPATSVITASGSRIRASGAGPALGWRLPNVNDPNDDCGTPSILNKARFLRDYIDDQFSLWFIPDQDIRLTTNYDVAGAKKVGVFLRGAYDFGTGTITNFYSVVFDGAANATILYANLGVPPVATELARGPLPATTGDAEVEVADYQPVRITVRIGGNPILSFTDSNVRTPTNPRPLEMDLNFGHMFGVYFPDAAESGSLGVFRALRHADLYLALKFPVNEAVYLLADGWQESREFYNVHFVSDPTAVTWSQSLLKKCGASPDCDDCDRSRNLMAGLGVKDTGTSTNLWQVNTTLQTLFLGCCDCLEKAYNCVWSNANLDECQDPPGQTFDLRPMYEPGKHIEINVNFTNERSPNTLPSWTNPRLAMNWLICPNTAPGEFATCLGTPCVDVSSDPVNGNCGQYVVGFGTFVNPATGVPGMNECTTTDYGTDGKPDGPLHLQFQFDTTSRPQEYTIPNKPGEHIAIMWEAGYTLDGDASFDDPNPDDHPWNAVLQRAFLVEGCTLPAYDLEKNSFWLAKTNSLCGAGQFYSRWNLNATAQYNIHEILGTANKSTIANPYPGAPLIPTISNFEQCVTPGPITNDVGYYAVFQTDPCASNSSRADP